MLAMSDINCIKHLRNKKGRSITKIKETLGINWRTAKKDADEDQLPESKIKQSNEMMYSKKWGDIISDWLFEDSKLKKRLRRTKKQMFNELRGLVLKVTIVHSVNLYLIGRIVIMKKKLIKGTIV
ncbi:hypothetical protein AA0X95_04285 [Bacillus sp. 1P10SD]|uniref:hypothetical protein n=1 Tax=Bacillus sp. 1P10SD TaxID=3132265 RepID=UPI0039A4F122